MVCRVIQTVIYKRIFLFDIILTPADYAYSDSLLRFVTIAEFGPQLHPIVALKTGSKVYRANTTTDREFCSGSLKV